MRGDALDERALETTSPRSLATPSHREEKFTNQFAKNTGLRSGRRFTLRV